MGTISEVKLSRPNISGDIGELSTLKEGFPEGLVSVAVVGTTGYGSPPTS